MVKAVLFDFDFTLADSAGAIVECLGYALKQSNLKVPTRKLMLSTIGMTLPDTFKLLAPGADFQELVKLFKERADQIMVDRTQLYKTVANIIKLIKGHGVSLGIISTKYRYRIEEVLEREKLLPYFDIIIGGEDVINHKPDPEGLNLAIRQLQCANDSVIYVGDSIIDAMTAHAAKVRFVGVTTGTTRKKDFQSFYPIAVINNLAKLAKLIEQTVA